MKVYVGKKPHRGDRFVAIDNQFISYSPVGAAC